MNTKLRNELIADLVWATTKQGAFQRARIYKSKVHITTKDKDAFRNHIKSFCYENLFNSSKLGKDDDIELIATINILMESVETKYSNILRDGKFQFGNAQKFINLYLKILWVVGKIGEPPHFPVDRIIQKGFKPIRSWTNMTEDEYLEVIKIARNKADNQGTSLAIWEADKYKTLLN